MNIDWEDDGVGGLFAGLEALDDAGRERFSGWGRLDPDPDEPELLANSMPVFDELDIEAHPPRLA